MDENGVEYESQELWCNYGVRSHRPVIYSHSLHFVVALINYRQTKANATNKQRIGWILPIGTTYSHISPPTLRLVVPILGAVFRRIMDVDH